MGLKSFGLTLLVAILAGITLSELNAWVPWAIRKLKQIAVRAAPRRVRERLDEEWAAYLDETPGHFVKLLRSTGFILASIKLRLREFSPGFTIIVIATETALDGSGNLKCAVVSKNSGINAFKSFAFQNLNHNGMAIDSIAALNLTYQIKFGENILASPSISIITLMATRENITTSQISLGVGKKVLFQLRGRKPAIKKGPWNL